MNRSRLLVAGTVFGLMAIAGGPRAFAQAAQGAKSADGVNQVPATVDKPDPLKRRLSDTERFKQQKALRGELHGEYKKWVDEDVRWIISDTELQAFLNCCKNE